MTLPQPRKPTPAWEPRLRYPQDYQQGVDTANRLIDRPARENRTLFISHALELVTWHMENWPRVQGKNGLTDRQWAVSAGFAHTLREYREAQSDA
jgi:hypothetical protein